MCWAEDGVLIDRETYVVVRSTVSQSGFQYEANELRKFMSQMIDSMLVKVIPHDHCLLGKSREVLCEGSSHGSRKLTLCVTVLHCFKFCGNII